MRLQYSILVLAVCLLGCGKHLSDNPDDWFGTKGYHVYFYWNTNGKEEYLGEVKTVSEGRMLALSFAEGKGGLRGLGERMSTDFKPMGGKHDYILCRITSDSDCASKHR